MRFIFLNDYVTETRNIKAGTICSVFNHEVIIGTEDEWLFDIDSNLAKRLGKIIE